MVIAEVSLKNAYIGKGREPGANTLAYYTFDGKNLNDSSGNGNTGTWYNNTGTYMEVKGGYRANLGGNSAVQLPFTVANLTNWTLNAWVNISDLTSYLGLLGTLGWSSGMMHINITSDRIEVAINGGSSIVYNTVLDTDTRYNIVITKDGTTYSIYLNNNLVATGTSNNFTNTGTLYLGTTYDTSRCFNGYMDEVIFENKTRTQKEITDYYNSSEYDYRITSLTLDKNSISLTTVGQTEQITATTVPANLPVTWSSSNTSIATVDNTGLVTCVDPGICTVTASSFEGIANCQVSSPITLNWQFNDGTWTVAGAQAEGFTFSGNPQFGSKGLYCGAYPETAGISKKIADDVHGYSLITMTLNGISGPGTNSDNFYYLSFSSSTLSMVLSFWGDASGNITSQGVLLWGGSSSYANTNPQKITYNLTNGEIKYYRWTGLMASVIDNNYQTMVDSINQTGLYVSLSMNSNNRAGPGVQIMQVELT